MTETSLAFEHRWLSEPLSKEMEAAIVRLRKTADVWHVAIMPDAHLGSEVCVGTVFATRHRLYPSAVGGDMGCGMAAIRFDSDAKLLANASRAARALAGLYESVPAHRRQPDRRLESLPEDLDRAPLSTVFLESEKRRNACAQFGTLGRGNHFVELQADEQDQLWLMVHSGSRAIGQAVLAQHLRVAEAAETGLPFLIADSREGAAYLDDLAWALEYAAANRRAIVAAVCELLESAFGVRAVQESYVACHHNYVQRETHGNEALWVHRKGAISARCGESGVIPGSMGSASFHVEGRGCAASLCSSSHGAGRTMSRSEARRKISVRAFEREMSGTWFDHRMADQLRDESPSAYKNITWVMRAQSDLTRIVRKMRPLLVYKGT